MKNCTLGKHISKINTGEETSQMVKEISQEKVKKIHFSNHFSISTQLSNEKLHSQKACIKTNIGEETSQMAKMSHYSLFGEGNITRKSEENLPLSQFLCKYSLLKSTTYGKLTQETSPLKWS